MKRIFEYTSISELWGVLRLASSHLSIYQNYSQSDVWLILLKFADGMIHEDQGQNLKGLELHQFVHTMQDLVNIKAQPLFMHPDSFSIAEAQCVASTIRLHLDIFNFGLDDSLHSKRQRLFGPNFASELASILVSTD